jgi:hypothetical protein
VWSTCDGAGAKWSRLSSAGPFPALQQAALVALYDYTAVAPSTLLLYADSVNTLYTSANGGSAWTTVDSAAPWSARKTAVLTAELEGGVYLVGGQGFGDAFYSINKGQSWTQLIAVTSTPSTSVPVVLSSTTSACSALLYTPSSSAPNGYHRQLVLYGGSISVYSSSSTRTTTTISYPTCSCNTLPGVRGLVADLVFPGESFSGSGSGPSTSTSSSTGSGGGGLSSSAGTSVCPSCPSCPGSTSSSSSSGSSLSSGAIAGIVIGCVIGVSLFFLLILKWAPAGKRGQKWNSVTEPSHVEHSRTDAGEHRQDTEEVEMGQT